MKTVLECVTEDRADIKHIEDTMNLCIGHELFGVKGEFMVYRGHYFTLTCDGKLAKKTGALISEP